MQNDSVNLLAELEQFETHVCNFARVVSEYYAELLKQGIDEDMARDLTLSFHNIWWASIQQRN